jgi:hypothetical protein
MIRLTALALLGLVGAACRYQPTPVVLQGTPADIAALHGEWVGEYSSPESGRSGSIVFTVVAGTDTAHGDVVMTTSRGQAIVAADASSPEHARHSASPTILRIRFVRVFGGMVEGEMEAYIAPDCQCVVQTVFQGTVTQNMIEGDYVTRSESGLRQQGRWTVWRRQVAAR